VSYVSLAKHPIILRFARFPSPSSGLPELCALCVKIPLCTHRSPRVFAKVRINIIPWDLRFLCFHTVTHSFAPRNPVTPFRSMASALFAQNTRGGGTLAPPGPFPLYPLRSPRVRTATPATPILSYIYFTFLWIPGGWGSAPILIASASPIPQASFARCLGTQDSRITGYGSRYTDHGFTAPFNFRLLALSVVEGSTLQVQSPRSIPEPTSLRGIDER
jgi:hypothetical protein